jgi:hypothetical protein
MSTAPFAAMHGLVAGRTTPAHRREECMKNRCVFSTGDLTTARAAMRAAHQAGIADDDIALLAREDIERAAPPEQRLRNRCDFYPALLRGALWGGGGGLVLGVVAGLVTFSSGLPLAGVLASCVVGAIAGCCMSAVAGAAVPDPVDRRFRHEIDSGRILVVIDVPHGRIADVEASVAHTGAELLPFHAHTALS